MTDISLIQGSGGGGKGGGGANPIEEADTLKSKSYAKVLDLICEGPIEGFSTPTEPAKSIYLDGVPLMNPDGTSNYNLKTFNYTLGTQNQAMISDFDTVQVDTQANLDLKSNEDGSPIYKTVAVVGSTTNKLKVNFNIPSMYEYRDNGDLVGYSTTFRYQILKGTGAVEYDSGNITISGKTSSKYTWGYSHTLAETNATGNYMVKAWRAIPQVTGSKKVDTVYFDSLSCITTVKLRYPNSVLVGLKIDSAYFSSIPTRGYLMKMLKVKVPHNYDPITRVYTGLWDGTVNKLAWSNNPAWCFLDLLTNERYGLGSYITTNQIDLPVLYEIARKCDELVPDPYSTTGATEPRFTLNAYIQSKQDAIKLLQDLASTFRGMVYWSTGLITAVQDSGILDPVMQFTNSNVVDGKFVFAGGSRKVMHNAALITWNDPKLDYKQRIEYITLDDTSITRYGYNPIETIAFGCTSRGQAYRVGKWLLYTDTYEAGAVSFKAALDSAYLRPGMVVRILDKIRAGGRQFELAGRIISINNSTSITLDRPIILTSGINYSISCNSLDTTTTGLTDTKRIGVQTYSVSAVSSDGKTITTSTPIDTTKVSVGSIWVLNRSDLTSELYRIVGIKETDTLGVYELNGIIYDPDKYAFVENNTKLPTNDYIVSNIAPQPVNTIPTTGYSCTLAQDGTILRVTTASASSFAPGDTIGLTGVVSGTAQLSYFTIGSITGTTLLLETGVTRSGFVSSGVIYVKNIKISDDIYISVGGAISTKLSLSFSPSINATGYGVTIKRYSLSGTTYSFTSETKLSTNSKDLSYEQLGVADGTYCRFEITPINSLGKIGPVTVVPPATIAPYLIKGKTVPPSNIVSASYTLTDTGVKVSWTGVVDLDLSYYRVKVGSSTYAASTLVSSPIAPTYLYADTATAYNIFLVAVDTSGFESSSPYILPVAITRLTKPTGVTATLVSGTSTYNVSWTAPVVSSNNFSIDYYEIYHTSISSSNLLGTSLTTSFLTSVNWVGTRSFVVRAVSKFLRYADAVGDPSS